MVLQLLAATEKTGQLEVRSDGEEHRGFLGISGGRLVSAQFEDEDGYLALGAVAAIDRGDFEFLPQDHIERTELSGEIEELLERAAVERERILSIRDAVPSARMRFRLSERATERGEITLAPQQWRALLLIDGKRDVEALAQELQMPRLAAQQLLAALVRAGLVDAVAPPEGVPIEGGAPRGFRGLPPMQPIPPTTSGEEIVLRGRLPDFPLETIVQLLAETKKTGRLEVRAGRDSSALGMADGQLVSANAGEEEGELGLGLAFTAQEGEFDFVPMDDAPAPNLSGALDPLLDRAAGIRDRIVGIRGLIPNERARFTLSERATRNVEIVLTPEQWGVLLGVNGERDVAGIADHLRMRQLPTMMVLSDLVNGGYVDVMPVDETTWPYVERRKTPWPAAAPSPWEEPPPPPAAEEEVQEEAVAVAEEEPLVEEPLEETPLDHEPEEDDRFAAIESVVGPAEPAPPPAAWEPPPVEPGSAEAALAEATAEAFAAGPPEAEPVAEPEARPAWETPSWETPAPAEEAPAEIDPRLAAFGAPAAQPEAPSWEAPATPAWEAPAWQAPAAEAPVAEPEPEPAPAVQTEAVTPAIERPTPVAPPVPERKKGLFGGLFGGGAKAASAPPTPRADTRAGQLASFANELVAAYNSGQYGKGRVEDRMLSLIMRADEQADPIDRALPIVNDRIDVGAIDRDGVPERQAVPYLAVVVRQIYDEAERVLGKDKARRGFRDVRDRLFGKDLALLQAPEVSRRLPKV